jgi:hypothetical protein
VPAGTLDLALPFSAKDRGFSVSGTDLDGAEVEMRVAEMFADAPAADLPYFRVALGSTAPVAGVVLEEARLRGIRVNDLSELGSESGRAILAAALTRARVSRVSISVRLSSITDRALSASLRQFAQAGFVTEIALAASSAEEESIAGADEITSAGNGGRIVSLAERRRSVAQRTDLTRTAVEAKLVDALVLLRHDGERRFTLSGAMEIDQASRSLEDVSDAPWTTLRTVRWLSDVRRMTEHIRSKREPAIDAVAVLDELHSFAIEVAVPALNLPAQSAALQEQLRTLRDRQEALRSLLKVNVGAASTAVVTPQSPSGPHLAR